MTRGDTLKVNLTLQHKNGEPYTPTNGDKIRFAAKKNYSDTDVLILKDIPTDTLLLKLDPDDTKSLKFRDYVYDIQITYANGDVDTFIAEATLTIASEVD